MMELVCRQAGGRKVWGGMMGQDGRLGHDEDGGEDGRQQQVPQQPAISVISGP